MTQTTLLEKALTKVKENGFKYTKKRETLLDYLIKSNRYVSAREVYNHMNGQFPGLSYDTVYRNLREFCEIGLIEDTELQGEMKFRFSCSENFEHHHHFICTVCGETKEIHMCPMRRPFMTKQQKTALNMAKFIQNQSLLLLEKLNELDLDVEESSKEPSFLQNNVKKEPIRKKIIPSGRFFLS